MIAAGKPLDLARFAGHTEGPWEAIIFGQGNGGGDICANGKYVGEASKQADMVLIAAAPALLAECQRQREVIAELRAVLVECITDDGAIRRNDKTLAFLRIAAITSIAHAAIVKTRRQS